jgi:hypothetical protein
LSKQEALQIGVFATEKIIRRGEHLLRSRQID